MKRYLALFGCLVLLLAVSTISLSTNSGGITVNGADLLETNSLSSSTTLLSNINLIADHITLQYGDDLRHLDLIDVPTELGNLLNTVADRVQLAYGDRVRHLPLTVVPSTLQNQLNAIADRVTLQYPDDNRRFALNYPTELIGDSEPPTIMAPPQANINGDTAQITWTTNEFTIYELQYGSSSGNYPFQVSSSQAQHQHTATITGLTEPMYYYRIVSTDLSGNSATSQEYTFEFVTEKLIYLPIVVRP